VKLTIASDTLRQIILHLKTSLPEEGCGLLATIVEGEGNRRIVRFYPGENIDHALTRYTMNPVQVFAAMREIETMGWTLGAIVHSHPRTPPAPSPTDLREAYYPDAWSMIVSFAHETPEVRIWALSAGVHGIEPSEISLVTLHS